MPVERALRAVLIFTATGLLAACEPPANRDAEGSITSDGLVDAFAMKVGDCFDDQDTEQIFDVPGRPCSEPHDNEVFAIFDARLSEFPGSEQMTNTAPTSASRASRPTSAGITSPRPWTSCRSRRRRGPGTRRTIGR